MLVDHVLGMAGIAVGRRNNLVVLGNVINTGVAVNAEDRSSGLAGSNGLLNSYVAAGVAGCACGCPTQVFVYSTAGVALGTLDSGGNHIMLGNVIG